VALDVEPEDVAGVGLQLLDVVSELDPSGLAAATDLHLSLHHDGVADTLRDSDGRVDGVGDVTG